MRWFESVGLYTAGFAVAVVTVVACYRPQPSTLFWCSPEGRQPSCPEDYICCSDDPAALDLENLGGVALPDYGDRGGFGIPLFSAARNGSGFSGLCVNEGSVPPVASLGDSGCPVPCNPTWVDEDVDAVCGEGQLCCQTIELELEDCVLDSGLGDAGCWRPVRGADIEGLGGIDATRWADGAHATHQDPGGQACEAFVSGLGDDELDAAGVERDAVRAACFRQLSVANQRGFCLGVQLCPLAQPSYRDACEQQNDAEGLSGCG